MFKWLRRLRALPPIPEAAWQSALRRYAFLGALPAADRQRLRTLTAEFLRDKEFHGAKGFTITNEVALAIAAQAVLPVLHLKGGLNWYDDFVGIVVHRSEVVARRKVVDEAQVVHEYGEVVAGEAMDRGPVMLSWDDVLASSITSERGYNVVIHEFAHKIDMRGGDANGCPPALRASAARAQPARRGLLCCSLPTRIFASKPSRPSASAASRHGSTPMAPPRSASSLRWRARPTS